MKILHVTKKYPNALGGDAIVVQNLEKQQTKNGHKVFILTTNCDEIINKKNLIKFGLKDTPSNLDKIGFKRILSLIQLYFKSFKILREIKPDVVHSHSVDMGYVMSKACRRYNIPIINHFHTGLISIKKTDKRRSKLERFFIKKSKFNKIITVNPNDINSKNSSKIIFVPNAIDLRIFKNMMKNRRESKNINLLFVGRVEKAKGVTYLIDSIQRIIKEKSNIKLTIIGEGNDFNYYKNLINKLNLKDNIQFEGHKNQRELVNYYYNADIFVLPSIEIEGFGLVLLESLACKTPVITTDIVGIANVIKKNNCGIVVKPKDSQALADAILRLLNNPKLAKQMGENGRKLVESKYNWVSINSKIESIYEDILK